jgi:hypothetical protein
MEVRSRLWLGGMISRHRDKELIRGLLLRVRCCGPLEKILLVTDGLSSYKSQALKIFREPIRTGKVGRPKLMLAAGVMVARVIKRYRRKRVLEVVREVVQGAQAAVISRVIGTQRSMVALINTLPTSSALTPPSESGWRRWRVGPAPGCTSAVRWRGECGWWALPTTSCGRSALSGRAAPRRWRRGSRIIAGRWRSC